MLQMASLSEEVNKRGGEVDGAARQLTDSISNGVAALNGTTLRLWKTSLSEGHELRLATVQLADGSRQIVGAFSDLL